MRSVAIRYGLRVNKKVDERTNIEKSAKAAAALLNSACIPKIKECLDQRNISYKETDLWFRLLVLHAYHAGMGNIRCVLDQISPTEGGIPLFQKVWSSTCRGFKNESQNYSQIAIASIINFDHVVNQFGDSVYMILGDKMMKDYYKKSLKLYKSYEYLNSCLLAYENDFIDGVITYEYFIKKVNIIRKELGHMSKLMAKSDKEIVFTKISCF
jgi:hypothetical protein